jgi:hypothetical protein
MSKDDLPDEGWNPEDEKLEKKFLKRLIELTEEQIKQAKAHAHDHSLEPLAFMMTCEIRPVLNGFIIRYFVTTGFCPVANKPPTAISTPKMVEAFAGNINDIIPHVLRAMQSMRVVADLSGGAAVAI